MQKHHHKRARKSLSFFYGATFKQAFVLVVLLLSFVVWAQSSTTEYYPQKAGSSWYFDDGSRQHLERVPDVILERLGLLELSDKAKKITWRLQVTTPVAGIETKDILAYTPAGLYWHGTVTGDVAVQYVPPLLVYKAAPMTVGDTWMSETDVSLLPLVGEVLESTPQDARVRLQVTVISVAGIETPVGRFNCLLIEQAIAVGNEQFLEVESELKSEAKNEKPERSIAENSDLVLRSSCFVPTLGVIAYSQDNMPRILLRDTNFYP